MGHVTPLPLDALPADVVAELERAASLQGFVSEMRRALAARPRILRALNDLTFAVMVDGKVDPGMKSLVALVSSVASGCRHCQAHTALRSSRLGVDVTKIDAVWEFEVSPLFDAAEIAALRFARDASSVPCAATSDHFAELRRHFDDGEVVELLSVVSLFGWNNRWNDAAATSTEDDPVAFARAHLEHRWEIGKHGPHPPTSPEQPGGGLR